MEHLHTAAADTNAASWPAALERLTATLNSSLTCFSQTYHRIPGSAILLRYIVASYQNDPIRSLLELLLLAFAVRTILQSRTRGGQSGTNFVKLSEKEIDDLVDEWTPEPLCAPLSPTEVSELASMPVLAGAAGPRPKVVSTGKTVLNLASYDFSGLANDERLKTRAIETLRVYGVGSCSPPSFYGTIDVHMQLEADIARFLGVSAAIIYSQAFSTISSVIPAFSKRGDILVVDRGVNFAIQKGIQISRSTVRYYEHGDMKSLEKVLEATNREVQRKGGKLTRRFIVTEGLFEGDGFITDLPKIIELKKKYKYRLMLDESFSFGILGATGRGLTELYDVPATEVDMLIGSMANTLGSGGGFCAGSEEVVFHQRINGHAFIFSAALPALLAVSASSAISHLTATPDALSSLRENTLAVRSVLDRAEGAVIPSHPDSPLIHVQIRPKAEQPTAAVQGLAPPVIEASTGRAKSSTRSGRKPGSSAALKLSLPSPHDLTVEEQHSLLQSVVEEALENGVLLTRHKRLPGIALGLDEGSEARPSLRIAVSGALSKEEATSAAETVRAALDKVLAVRR